MKLAKFFDHDFKETCDDNDLEAFKLYNEKGEMIYCQFPEKYDWWAKHKYDSQGRMISKECSDGYWWTVEFDADGNEINCVCSDDKYGEMEDKISAFDDMCLGNIPNYKKGTVRSMFIEINKTIREYKYKPISKNK